jgi:hypothetical protein
LPYVAISGWPAISADPWSPEAPPTGGFTLKSQGVQDVLESTTDR